MLSSSRRLIQRRDGAAGSSSSRAARHSGASDVPATAPAPAPATVDLPPYQPPSCAATAEARRALAELSNNRNARYEEHIRKAIKALSDSIGDINDSLGFRQARLGELGPESKERALLETYVAGLERDVTELSKESELAVRRLIDHQAALEDEARCLSHVHTTVATQQPARRRVQPPSQDGGGDGDSQMGGVEDEAPPVQGPLELMNEARARKAAEYAALGAYERYGLNNDYAGFRRLWHDAVHGDEVPLQDARRWFDRDGNPVVLPGRKGRGGAGDEEVGGDDEDEELVIRGEVRDYKCPLSLREMVEPYTSRVCKHSFEKTAILEFIGHQRRVRCPVCTREFSKNDLYSDEVLLRQLKRAREAREARERDEDEEMAIADRDTPMSGKKAKLAVGRHRVADGSDEDN